MNLRTICAASAGFLLALTLSGCKTTGGTGAKAARPQPQPPQDYKPAEPQLQQIPGENCCARLAPDGQWFVYLSRQRDRHAHWQIYRHGLSNSTDRRITFHDGDDQGPHVTPDGRSLIYASTTDEDKEYPAFLAKAVEPKDSDPQRLKLPIGPRPLWTNQPFEIYRSNLDGSGIERLTSSKGFDAEIDSHPKGQAIVFTSTRGGRAAIHRVDSQGQQLAALTDGSSQEGEPAYSPDGREMVWVRYSDDLKSSQLWISDIRGKKSKALTLGEGLRQSPAWTPDGKSILFSSNLSDPENFELYMVERDGSCPRRLTFDQAGDRDPDVTPDGKKVLFTSDRSGVNQLYLMDLAPPPCPPAQGAL